MENDINAQLESLKIKYYSALETIHGLVKEIQFLNSQFISIKAALQSDKPKPCAIADGQPDHDKYNGQYPKEEQCSA
jgi:hypothetical protein